MLASLLGYWYEYGFSAAELPIMGIIWYTVNEIINYNNHVDRFIINITIQLNVLHYYYKNNCNH